MIMSIDKSRTVAYFSGLTTKQSIPVPKNISTKNHSINLRSDPSKRHGCMLQKSGKFSNKCHLNTYDEMKKPGAAQIGAAVKRISKIYKVSLMLWRKNFPKIQIKIFARGHVMCENIVILKTIDIAKVCMLWVKTFGPRFIMRFRLVAATCYNTCRPVTKNVDIEYSKNVWGYLHVSRSNGSRQKVNQVSDTVGKTLTHLFKNFFDANSTRFHFFLPQVQIQIMFCSIPNTVKHLLIEHLI